MSENQPRPWSHPPEDCPLVVAFNSVGTGIDTLTLAKVEALLAADSGVGSIERHHWGREGETTLCVRPKAGTDAERLFHLVKAAFPTERQSSTMSVSTRTGLSFSTGGGR